MITTSEIKISVLVGRDRCDEVVRIVHDGFGLHERETVAPRLGSSRPAVERRASRSRDEIEHDVVARLAAMEDIVVSEVQLDCEQALVTLRNLPDDPGVATRVFSAVAEGGIMVDMIVQNVSHRGIAHLSFTVPRNELEACIELVRGMLAEWPGTELDFDPAIAKLTVMGIGLRSHTGVGERMFRALGDAGVNIRMINTSEIRMSSVISLDDGPQAHAALLAVFGL